MNKAAWELEAIRNDRTTDAAVLLKRVDEIGRKLAAQKYSKLNAKLLSECHELSARLGGK